MADCISSFPISSLVNLFSCDFFDILCVVAFQISSPILVLWTSRQPNLARRFIRQCLGPAICVQNDHYNMGPYTLRDNPTKDDILSAASDRSRIRRSHPPDPTTPTSVYPWTRWRTWHSPKPCSLSEWLGNSLSGRVGENLCQYCGASDGCVLGFTHNSFKRSFLISMSVYILMYACCSSNERGVEDPSNVPPPPEMKCMNWKNVISRKCYFQHLKGNDGCSPTLNRGRHFLLQFR